MKYYNYDYLSLAKYLNILKRPDNNFSTCHFKMFALICVPIVFEWAAQDQ